MEEKYLTSKMRALQIMLIIQGLAIIILSMAIILSKLK